MSKINKIPLSDLEKAVKEIVRVAKRAGSRVCGPTPIPNKKKYFTYYFILSIYYY